MSERALRVLGNEEGCGVAQVGAEISVPREETHEEKLQRLRGNARQMYLGGRAHKAARLGMKIPVKYESAEVSKPDYLDLMEARGYIDEIESGAEDLGSYYADAPAKMAEANAQWMESSPKNKMILVRLAEFDEKGDEINPGGSAGDEQGILEGFLKDEKFSKYFTDERRVKLIDTSSEGVRDVEKDENTRVVVLAGTLFTKGDPDQKRVLRGMIERYPNIMDRAEIMAEVAVADVIDNGYAVSDERAIPVTAVYRAPDALGEQ